LRGAIPSLFLRLSIFQLDGFAVPRPSAGNAANRWTLRVRKKEKMKIIRVQLAIMLMLVFLTTACAEDVNIRVKNITYFRSEVDSPNAFLVISLMLKEFPSDLKTIYAENIIFTFKNGWEPHEKYLNGPFAIQTGNPKRFAFNKAGYTTQYQSWFFDYSKPDAFLNVDEWIKRDSCPFEKIQLQGLSANVAVALPDTLDISFPCNLDSIKICLAHDDFFGGCTKWAP
jgi:hypothetical protein